MKNFLKRFVSLVLIAFYILPVFSGFANAQPNSSTPAFYFRPTGEKGAKIIFDNVQPGQTLTGSLSLSMLENVPSLFSLSFNDAASGMPEGMAVSGDLSSLKVASWINFPAGTKMILKNKEVSDFPFVMKVPEGISPGDYSGMFVASLVSYGDQIEQLSGDITKLPNEQFVGAGTKITIASGVECIIRVAGETKSNLSFNDLKYVMGKNKELNLVIAYSNVGNITVFPQAHVVITDLFGKRLYSGDFQHTLSSPGVSSTLMATVNPDQFRLGYGAYNVNVDLRYTVYKFDKNSSADVFSAGIGEVDIYVVPWILILAIGILILLIILYYVYKNVKYVRLCKISKEYIVKETDTLQSVSNKFKVDPELIILVNKIKKPYFLMKDQKLLIPCKK